MSQEFEVVAYRDESGREPFATWISDLDWKWRSVVNLRLARIKSGNFGDCKFVGNEVYELRIHCGAGYRIYFAKEGRKLILLLCGGNKSSQEKDIRKAKKFLQLYHNRFQQKI